jgi:hypothetical protein
MSECAAAAKLGRHPRSHMQRRGMLIDGSGCLGATVASGVVEVEGGDTMFAEGTSKDGATVRGFGCVVSHVFSVVLSCGEGRRNRCATLELKQRRFRSPNYKEHLLRNQRPSILRIE